MRMKPITPRIAPSVSPVGSSREAMRHQSRERHLAQRQRANDQRRRLRSGVAARAHDQRNEQRQHDGLARSRPRSSCIAVAVSISPRKSAHSQPARFLIIATKLISMYGSSSASIPPNFCTSSVCSRTIASITSSTVTMPSTCPLVVDHRHREQVVLRDAAARRPRDRCAGCTVSGARCGADLDRRVCVAIGQHQLAQRDDVHDAPACPDRGRRWRRPFPSLRPRSTMCSQRLLHRPVAGHDDELRRHDAARVRADSAGAARACWRVGRVERLRGAGRARSAAARGRDRPAGRPTSPRAAARRLAAPCCSKISRARCSSSGSSNTWTARSNGSAVITFAAASGCNRLSASATSTGRIEESISASSAGSPDSR